MNEIRRADAEVHIVLGDGPEPSTAAIEQALPRVSAAFDAPTRRLTLRFEGDSIDRVTTDALKLMIDKGHTIREVHRGQSLLSTYLEVSGS